MSGYGHLHSGTSMRDGGFLDVWGRGPFVIEVGDKSYRFEDSNQFGPSLLRKDNEIASRQPGANSPFWDAWRAWVDQGRMIKEGGETCFYIPKRQP